MSASSFGGARNLPDVRAIGADGEYAGSCDRVRGRPCEDAPTSTGLKRLTLGTFCSQVIWGNLWWNRAAIGMAACAPS